MQTICGRIHMVDEKNRIIGIVIKKHLTYFYITRSQMQKFSLYFKEGLFVYFNVEDKPKIRKKYLAYEIKNFIKLTLHNGRRTKYYYDSNHIQEELKKILVRNTYRLFLDLEFTMPSYNHKHKSGDFVTEIIRYGLYLEDPDGNLVDSANGFVKPRLVKSLSDRTLDFLNITNDMVMKAKPFYNFYDILKDYMVLYQPTIYVWWRNDILVLDKSYEMYNLKRITKRNNFINLMQIIKTYFNIKDDIGLYAAYKLFDKKPPMDDQDHNPLHDAECAMDIYHLFVEYVNK